MMTLGLTTCGNLAVVAIFIIVITCDYFQFRSHKFLKFFKKAKQGKRITSLAWQPAPGSTRSIDLAGDGFGWISQTFATTQGTPYRVTFYMAGNPDGGERYKDIFVSAGSASQAYSFDTNGKSITNMGWDERVFNFTADSAQTTLTFLSLEGTSPYGAALDNVHVSAIPIPAAAWLLGTGLFGLVLIRRRMKK